MLTKSEVAELMKAFDVTKYSGIHLVNKLESGAKSSDENIAIEISEDELEILLDEVGVPLPDEKSEMVSVRAKLNALMIQFRSQF